MNSQSEIVSVIRKNILFVDIKDEVLFQILEILSLVEIKQDAVIYNKGDVVDGLYLVQTGDVQILAERDDEQYILSNAPETYLFGEFLLQGDSVRSTSAKVLVDSQLLFLPRDLFNSFLQRFPTEGAIIGSRIVNRLCWNQTTLALRLSHLFVGLSDDIVRSLIQQIKIESIPSNTVLIAQNAITNELWIVIDGQFQINKTNEDGLTVKLGVLGRGEAIGEVGVICETPSSSQVISTRDSTVAKLSRKSFETILKKYPVEINQTFVKSVIGHLRSHSPNKTQSAETFALVMLSSGLDAKSIGLQLGDALNSYGSTIVLSSEDVDKAFSQQGAAQSSFDHSINTALLQWLSEQEIAHRHIIYTIDNKLSNWTLRCLRQADHIVFCANVTDSPEISSLEQLVLDEIDDKGIKQSLVLVHPASTRVPTNTARWINNRQISMHHHIKEGSRADFGKVSRFLTGNAIGLVLGGGGARGFAHIGVMRAFKELNIPIDLIGGNSMGAVIAAQYAMQWDYQEMIDKTKRLCLQGDQFTLPIMSIFSGEKMTTGLREMFDDICIEDLWINFFSISCNISRATVMTHDKGTLLAAVLNSNAPPGLFPPQIVDGDLLVDGALLNNVPVDVMARFNEGGTIIAVDVNAREDLLNNTDNTGGMSGWRLLLNKLNPMAAKIRTPSMIEVLSRASIIGGLAQRKKLMSGVADLYLQPTVSDFSLMAYKDAEKIERAGYHYAKQELQQWLQVKK
ncbi:MAG: cyclic nucleotide-binding domain-containing protein [Methylomarinum sp.]|nr:cyclic nucleotide-binding domain-containing protein [Methylomarinum sp.]